MNDTPGPNWTPDPQLLEAYFDGELEGRDDVADLRAGLEAWLDTHPEVAGEWTKHQQLRKLWLDTTPVEPNAATWKHALDQIDAGRRQPVVAQADKPGWWTASIVAASIALFFGLLFGALHSILPSNVKNDPVVRAPREKPNPDDMEVFPVATAEEVVIQRVEGADTSLLVVGRPPVDGPLELAAPGEVRVVHVHPDARDQMMPTVLENGPRAPMIWAKLDTD